MSSSKRHHLLLTNDDGIHAEGLQHLIDVLSPLYDILVVAPDRECSATSHGISVLSDLWLERYERDGKHRGWSLQGRPADCVKLAVQTLSKEKPFDLVISGINRGQNLGVNVLYSGTVAAAREGALHGIPSVAYSIAYRDNEDVRFETAARVALDLTAKILDRGLPGNTLLNVNVPPVLHDELQGYAITRQGDSGYRDKFEHVEGRLEDTALFRNVGDRFYKSSTDAHDNDDRAIKERRVSITPLHLDSTAHQHLNQLDHLL